MGFFIFLCLRDKGYLFYFIKAWRVYEEVGGICDVDDVRDPRPKRNGK